LWKDKKRYFLYRKIDYRKCDFISSTSVYGDNNDQVTEETPLNPDSEGGKQLQIVETLYKIILFKTTVVSAA
jgi:hypothetical protein